MPTNSPVSNGTAARFVPEIERGPGSITSLARSAPVNAALRIWDCSLFAVASGMSSATLKSYHAAFLFATCTVHSTAASFAVTSPKTRPFASYA